MTKDTTELREVIDRTLWIDTHEHLLEERSRLREGSVEFTTEGLGIPVQIPADWSSLLMDYAWLDLVSAGLPLLQAQRLRGSAADPGDKWSIVEPYFAAARQTGYLRAVDITTDQLFGLRLAGDTYEEIDRRCRDLRKEGYYRSVLRDVARVERCHVNSMESNPFCVTDSPDLLEQDLSILPLTLGAHRSVEERSGITVSGLDSYLEVMSWCFETFGPAAVAVKSQWAYLRPLAIGGLDGPPRRAFKRLRLGDASVDDRRAVEDFLFEHALDLAAEAHLPVKLHLGYLDGTDLPQLPYVFDHVRDIAPVVQAHPRTQFILMHMAWPQQEQLIALAKHQPNVIVDLCWAWIMSPRATTEFVQRFVTTVPANKLLCFGGDYMTVETVVGHAEIARHGLHAALRGLVEDDWLTLDEAKALIRPLMRGNAERVFGSRAEAIRE
jgi:hypothetical protein